MSRQKPSTKEVIQVETSVENFDKNSIQPDMSANRRTQKVFHHLFKAAMSMMKKNVSWVKGNPNLQDVEHVHFFHSVDSYGIPLEYTNDVGGHFHKVEWQIIDGKPVAKCGPALKKITTRGPGGLPKTRIVEVQFDDFFNDADGRKLKLVDRHVHEMNYLGWDELSSDLIKNIQSENARVTSASVPKNVPPAQQIGAAADGVFEMSDADRA